MDHTGRPKYAAPPNPLMSSLLPYDGQAPTQPNYMAAPNTGGYPANYYYSGPNNNPPPPVSAPLPPYSVGMTNYNFTAAPSSTTAPSPFPYQYPQQNQAPAYPPPAGYPPQAPPSGYPSSTSGQYGGSTYQAPAPTAYPQGFNPPRY